VARNEADRVDLLAEAVALTRRAELLVPDELEPVVAGLRDRGDLSVYFGPDPVVHADADGRIRRLFADGALFRTQGDTLARLERVRTDSAVHLLRSDLEPDACRRLLDELATRLARLLAALEAGRARLVRAIPVDDDLRPELAARLRTMLAAGLRLAPAIPGKR
jgi:hypothetical protein